MSGTYNWSKNKRANTSPFILVVLIKHLEMHIGLSYPVSRLAVLH